MSAGAKVLHDVAKVAGGAVNIASGLREQIRNDIKARVEAMITQLDLVPREDLDDALTLVKSLNDRVADLEARLDKLDKPAAKKTAPVKKPAAKTKTATKKKASAKKAAPKKTAPKKTAAKKTAVKKAATKKTTAK